MAKLLQTVEEYTYDTVFYHLDFLAGGINIREFSEDVYHGSSPHYLPSILLRGLSHQPRDTGDVAQGTDLSKRCWGGT